MRAVIGLGSNMGDPAAEVLQSIAWLGQCHRLVASSSLYRSAPIGFTKQAHLINAIAVLVTDASPGDLLRAMLAYEQGRGRQRTFPNASRPLDLDLLLYGENIIQTPRLIVPHPRMHERAFVLVPLLEIMPDLIIPGKGPARLYMDALSPCQHLERISHESFDHH
jgi:2-amino-4-hydroxy-6-hydroxymethyldihydropteridine diphosphokinase